MTSIATVPPFVLTPTGGSDTDLPSRLDPSDLFGKQGFSFGVLDADADGARGANEKPSFYKQIVIGGKSYVLSYEKVSGADQWKPKLYAVDGNGRLSSVSVPKEFDKKVSLATTNDLNSSVQDILSAVRRTRLVKSIIVTIEELISLMKKLASDQRYAAHKAALNRYVAKVEAAYASYSATIKQAIAGIAGAGFAVMTGLLPLVFAGAPSFLKTLRSEPVAGFGTGSPNVAGEKSNQNFMDDIVSVSGDCESSGNVSKNRFALGFGSGNGKDQSTDAKSVDEQLEEWIKRFDKIKRGLDSVAFSTTMVVPQLGESVGQVIAAGDTLTAQTLEALADLYSEFLQELDEEVSANKSTEKNLYSVMSN